jgi:hypothetical protein
MKWIFTDYPNSYLRILFGPVLGARKHFIVALSEDPWAHFPDQEFWRGDRGRK